MLRTIFILLVAVASSAPLAPVAVVPREPALIPPLKDLVPVIDSISLFIKPSISKAEPGIWL